MVDEIKQSGDENHEIYPSGDEIYPSGYSVCQCQSSPGFNTSILRHSGIWGVTNEALLNKVQVKKPKIPFNENDGTSCIKVNKYSIAVCNFTNLREHSGRYLYHLYLQTNGKSTL